MVADMAMKRFFLIAITSLLSSICAHSQVGEQLREFSIGANAGALYNSVSFTPTIEQSMYFSYTAGATVRYMCENYMGLDCGVQLELNYVRRGWNEEAGYGRDINYFNIPFLAHLAYGKKRVKGVLNLGPEFSFLMSEKERGLSSPTYNRGRFADNKLDYGITGGLGMEVVTGIGHFIIEGRYYYALSDIYRNGKTDFYARSAHNTISVKLTYLYDILK